MYADGIQQKPVGVFWDIENCSVPKNKSPSDIIAYIRNFFIFNRLNHREYEFIISCDVTKLRKDVPDDINKAGGVTLAHVNGNNKNAADEKLRENMKKFVDTHASSSSPVLILISGDIDFVQDLRGYQTRLGCSVVLIHGSTCSSQFKVGWNEIYCFTSFCSAVRDNPAVSSADNFQRKQQNPNHQDGPVNQHYHGGQHSLNNQRGQQTNVKNHSGHKPFRPNQPGNSNDIPQRPAQFNQKPRAQNPANGMAPGHQPFPDPWQHRGQRFPVAPQHQGPQFYHGNKSKVPRNGANEKLLNIQHLPMNNISPTDVPATDQVATNKFILMVGGLPGKMDFKILKDNLQFEANKVHGKVTYVKNGQAFITFKQQNNANLAVELFNGKQVFGKTLNVVFTKSIPFEDRTKENSKSDSHGLDMVKKAETAGGSKKSKKKHANTANTKASASSNGTSSNDPLIPGLESIIDGIVGNGIGGASGDNRSPEPCLIQ